MCRCMCAGVCVQVYVCRCLCAGVCVWMCHVDKVALKKKCPENVSFKQRGKKNTSLLLRQCGVFVAQRAI